MKRKTARRARVAILGVLVLCGCDRSPAAPDNFGAGLESSATRTVSVDDPAVQKRAFTLEIPKNWRFTGMISRPAGCHGPAVAADGLTFTAMAPDTITAIEKLPGVSWAWISDGSGFPNCKPVNISTAAAFLLNVVVPNLRPDATNIRMMPLASQTRQAIDSRNRELQSQGNAQTRQTIDVAQVRLNYTYRGHPVEEMLGTSILCREIDMPAYPMLHRPAIQRHICSSPGITLLRAPQGALDALIAHPLTAVKIDPQWDSQIQQQMQAQFAAWKHANDVQFASIQEHFKNVTEDMLKRGVAFQAQQKSSFENAMAQDRATQASIDHAAQMQVRDSLDRQLFIDPTTGRRIETSNQYSHSWISSDGGTVALNGDPTFDPNGVIDPVRQSWTELIPVN